MKKCLLILRLVLIITMTGVYGVPACDAETRSQEDNREAYGSYVGWYEITPERFSLVTWGAKGGLLILDFEGLSFERLVPSGGDLFVWRRGEESVNREVSFQRNEQRAVTGFSWRGQDGSQGAAKKSESYGYRQEEIRFKNGGITLTGLLMLPGTKGPHPAAAIIHGSGDSDRNNVWAFTIADYMARHGIAVLFPDKRGSGKSEGDWHKADFKDLAGDALAAIEVFKRRREIDPRGIGLVGLSQGGWIAPLAASMSRDVGFVVDVSGSAVSPGEQVAHEMEQDFRRAGLSDSVIEDLMKLLALAQNHMRKGEGWEQYLSAYEKTWAPLRKAFPSTQDDWRWQWWRAVIDFDPVPLWEKLRRPALIVYGQEDEKDNVPVKESVARLDRMIRKAGKKDFTIKVYPNSGHAIEDPATKWVRKDFLDFLTRWILERMGG